MRRPDVDTDAKEGFRLPSAGSERSAVSGDSSDKNETADYACRRLWSNSSDAGSIPAISTIKDAAAGEWLRPFMRLAVDQFAHLCYNHPREANRAQKHR